LRMSPKEQPVLTITMSAIDAVDGSSTGIAMFHSAVLKMSVVGTKQTFALTPIDVCFRRDSVAKLFLSLGLDRDSVVLR